MTDPIERMSAGYGAPSLDSPIAQKAARKQRDAAKRHVEDPELERALSWKNNDDPRFDKLDAHTRTALGYYERDRAAAKELDR